jgi:tetratricopeptide (TPR) repeat protein
VNNAGESNDRVEHNTPALTECRERHLARSTRLDVEDATAQLASLKAEIISLFKEAESAIAAHTELLSEVRALASRWKTLDAAQKTTPASTVRVDHLGASTFIEKGWSRLSIGTADAAEQSLRRALELAPSNVEAATLLAWSLIAQEKLEAARSVIDSVLANDPQSALALAVGGLLLVREGNAGAAIDQLRRSIEHGRYDKRATLYAHLYLGVALRELGRHADAIIALKRALEIGPNLLEAAFELGHTQWAAGDREGALGTWRDAASANKFSPWGKRCAEVLAMHERGEMPVAAQQA